MDPVSASPLAALRRRTSSKWRDYPDDVLPMFVAEMDYPLAPVIADRLHSLVDASDTGYVGSPGPLPAAFAGFARRRWGWEIDEEAVMATTADVSMGIVEVLRQGIRPGDGVIVMPPVYPPFFDLVPEAGGRVVEVPLSGGSDQGWRIDLDGIRAALAAGARAVLLCNPHNPLGLVHDRADLVSLAGAAAEHGALVVSDEIHGPLVHPGVRFTPFLAVGEKARRTAVAVTSASKGWNLAGLKCALLVAEAPGPAALLRDLPSEVGYRTGLFGLHANAVAFRDGEEWLDGILRAVRANAEELAALLAESLPRVRYRIPDASYLAWLDLRALSWGADPAETVLERTRIALASGPAFGAPGAGHARLNLACSPDVLREAVSRLADLAARD